MPLDLVLVDVEGGAEASGRGQRDGVVAGVLLDDAVWMMIMVVVVVWRGVSVKVQVRQRSTAAQRAGFFSYPEMLMVRWSIMCGCLATSRVYLR